MKSLFILFFIASSFMASAQAGAMFTKAEELQKIKNGKLIVAVFDSTDKIKDYHFYAYNVNIKKAIEKFWNYCPVEYKSIGELESIKDSMIYFLIPAEVDATYEKNGVYGASSYSYLKIGSSTSYYTKTKVFDNKNYIASFKKSILTSVASSFSYLSIAGCLKSMKDVITYKTSTKEEKQALGEVQKNSYKQVKNKTVYFAKEDLNEKLTEEDIKGLYSFPFKIVSKKEVEKAVEEGKQNAAYAILESRGYKDQMMLYVKDMNTLENLAYVLTTNWEIKKKEIKALNSFVDRD